MRRTGVDHPEQRIGFHLQLAVLCAVIAAAGFVPVYYLPVLRGSAGFPPRVHVHAAVATMWVVLLVVQAALINAGWIRRHRQVGTLGVVAAILFVPLTFWPMAGMLTRSDPPGELETAVFFPQLGSLCLFAGFVAAGAIGRRHAERHKRFMIMATVALLGTPIARMEVWGINAKPLLILALWNIPWLILAGHDLRTRRRVHWVTGVCGAALLAVQFAAVALMENPGWRSVVERIANLLRG